eukprot:TRINITY_DN808_c0_g1_i3.p1 TRINITY_DN808_c0_g1~~TRINITY_DN808_c0_g1_i3.p1  ORF type:complete len:215 (-),score=25.99 TRINITY_DN808_c0_g1_i3:35-679(-)
MWKRKVLGGVIKSRCTTFVKLADIWRHTSISSYTTTSSLDPGLDVMEGIHDKDKLFVSGYARDGFIVNNVTLPAPFILLPSSLWLWNAPPPHKLETEHFALLELISPTIQLLLLGVGKTPFVMPQHLADYFDSKGIAYELMSSVSLNSSPKKKKTTLILCFVFFKKVNAATTFNFLNQEDRKVALAIYPQHVVPHLSVYLPPVLCVDTTACTLR